MKKNVFCLIVDALSYPLMNDEYNPMPFLSSLRKISHDCTEIYSQGPYTEAALTPFYTGKDNLSFGGNLFRGGQASRTVFEAFDENGYDVLAYTQPLIYPAPMGRGVNNERWGVSYFFSAVWEYRLEYFRDLYVQGRLTEAEFDDVFELLGNNLSFRCEYLHACRDGDSRADFVNDYAAPDFPFDEEIEKSEKQYALFLKDKRAYTEDLFRRGTAHETFAVKDYLMLHKAENADVYEKIGKTYANLLRKIGRFNAEHNRGEKISFCSAAFRFLKNFLFSREEAKGALKSYRYSRRLRSTRAEIEKTFSLRGNYKAEPTISRYYAHFKKWYEQRNGENPFMCYMHVSDLHTPEIFFSVDSNDFTEVSEELSVAERYLDSLPEDFKGNVVYYLSMRFVDYHIEKIFNDLRQSGILDDSLFMVTADHGSSFGLYPIRNSIVNNEHEENFHIPCVLYAKDVSAFSDRRFFTTKDMAKTMLSYCGISGEEFTGKDILDTSKKGDCCAITEYFGQGCPDIRRKPVFFVGRNEEYSVCLKQPISQPFSRQNAIAVYDRKADPKERHNIVKTAALDSSFGGGVLKSLENRFNEIQGEYYGKH